MEEIHCSGCDFKDRFEPCEFGLTQYQVEGTCPLCGQALLYADGSPTAIVVEFITTQEEK